MDHGEPRAAHGHADAALSAGGAVSRGEGP
jgi:hypothetical protein